MKTQDFIKLINEKRKQSTGWYTFVGIVDGKEVVLKAYDRWNQILKVDGINHGGINHRKVADWKMEIEKALQYGDQ